MPLQPYVKYTQIQLKFYWDLMYTTFLMCKTVISLFFHDFVLIRLSLPGIYGVQFQLAKNFVHNARNISIEFDTYIVV